MPTAPSDVFRDYAQHESERRSPLMVGVLEGAARDWDAGGITRAVLDPYTTDPTGSALPLRFAAALHRLVLTGHAPELADHYPTVGGTAPPADVWSAARRTLERHAAVVREWTGLPCQTNEVGRAVPLLLGLVEVARRTGAPLHLLEIGASAGLNLLLDRFRFGDRSGPPDSPCRLPDAGADPTEVRLRIERRAGCDLAPLDPSEPEARLRLSASVWGDQVERFERLRGALAVASAGHVPVEAMGAGEWLERRLTDSAHDGPVPVVWHSIVRSYVDPAEWGRIERLTARPGVWRLSYEPDPGANPLGIPLRLHGPGTGPDGDVLAYGTGHGPPLSPAK